MQLRTRIGSAVVAVAVVGGLMVETSGTAVAGGYGCSGTLVGT